MKKTNLLIAMLLAFFLIFTVGCESDNSTEPEENNNSNTNSSGQPMPAFEGGNIGGVLATIGYEFATFPGLPAAQMTMAFAQFGAGVDGGNVTVNGNDIGKTTSNGNTFYIYPSLTNPTQVLTNVSFNGSTHSWTVSGAGSVPSFSGNVNSPRSFNVTAPAENATITKASGMTVSWDAAGGAQNVLITVVDISSSKVVFAEELNDNGSHTFTSAQLADISGDAMIQIVKYNYNLVSAGGKDYAIISEIVKTVNVKVQ